MQLEQTCLLLISALIFALTAIVTGFGREIGTHMANWFISSPKQESTAETSNGSNIFVVGEDLEIDTSGQSVEIKQLGESVSANRAESLSNSPKLFVEGRSDRVILKAALDYFCNKESREMYPCDVNIFEAEGAANMSKAVKWGSSEGDNYCVLLDSDVHDIVHTQRFQDVIDKDRTLLVDYVDSEAVTLFDLLPERFQSQPGTGMKSIQEFQRELDKGRINDSELAHLKHLLWEISERLNQ